MQRVNILLSTYNGKKYIEEQLNSIINQTHKDFHLYIRDDGSSDGTFEVLRTYISVHCLEERITLVRGENIGFSQSFKYLLDISSKGDYWAFCDQDDVWYPDKLKHAIEWMKNQNDAIPLMYHSGIEIADEKLMNKKTYNVGNFQYNYYNSFTSNIFFGFAILINRALYSKLVQVDFSKIKYHDWFVAMIATSFGKHCFSGTIDAVHRVHKNNSSPLYFWKKIPAGFKLIAGDDFYNRNAREFWKLFSSELDEEKKKHCLLFINEQYNFKYACKKAFYKKRWNPQVGIELIQRMLMLIGKI